MTHLFFKVAVPLSTALTGLLMLGCSGNPASRMAHRDVSAGNDLAAMAPASSGVDSIKVADEGLNFLQNGDYERARRLFSAAIKFDAGNGDLHMLLGMTYHLEFIKTGAEEAREKSEVGYQIASRYSPKSVLPWLQLGRLDVDAHHYKSAAKIFAKAILVSPGNGEALYGLASSSYLSGDMVSAMWAAEELKKIHWNLPAVNRLNAVLFNAVGMKTQADESRAAYAQSGAVDPEELALFDERLGEIRGMMEGQKWLTPPPMMVNTVASAIASDTAPVTVFAPAASFADPASMSPPTPVRATATATASITAPLATPVAATNVSEIGTGRKSWYDCAAAAPTSASAGGMGGAPGMGGILGMGGGMGGIGGMGGMGGFGSSSALTNVGNIPTSGSGEETSQLQALPAPCIGAAPPRMAVIDAVLLRTEDSDSNSYGVNLLQGLNLFFNQSTVRTTPGSSVQTLNYGIGGANIATALAYSLNIANAANNRNEVIARPSLLAIDRLPSTFFSGTTASIAVPAGAGGISSLIDKQYGISFSVTPTFIDDKSALLSIKAVRSFVELPDNGTSGVALSLSRNSVTANVVASFGETVILSGLTERELTRSNSGVPVLRDIPVAQYLFQNYKANDFFRTVMIMVTLRKPVSGPEQVAAAMKQKLEKVKGAEQRKDYAFYWRIDEYKKFLNTYAPNLDATIDTLETNELYQIFKSKDLIDTNWSARPRLSRMLNDMRNILYHSR